MDTGVGSSEYGGRDGVVDLLAFVGGIACPWLYQELESRVTHDNQKQNRKCCKVKGLPYEIGMEKEAARTTHG
ncbi:hypothetical protein BY996DRAFT_6592915 [Phakopsora pachyrhizi]|nr:hypothetical protein BY996DRAFT_6592915 [Phakopsora pachyrhizi]